MLTSQYRYDSRATEWRMLPILALSCSCFVLQPSKATAMFPDLKYPKQPDRTQLKIDAVKQIAIALARPCSSQTAVAWNSMKPRDDLLALSGDMMDNLPAFDNLTEVSTFPGGAITGSQRLYTGKLRADSFVFTFLWIAGQDNVTLQICSDQPTALTAKQKFIKCVTTTGSIATPLETCPPNESM